MILGVMVGWFGFGELAATALPGPSHPSAKPLQLTTTDDTGVGSLRWAITQANASPDDDLIAFDEIQGKVLLHSPLPAITTNLMLMGNGDDVISGGDRHRVLQVDGGNVVIRGLTLADGLAQGDDGLHGGGGGAGMGGGLLIRQGTVRISQTRFINNQAVGGSGSSLPPLHIQTQDNQLQVNRGAIVGIEGIGFSSAAAPMAEADISRTQATIRANRGAIAGVSGIGVNGIGTIAFGGGGGFGGFGNAGNGGNGGNGGTDSGNGGNGGNGGDGGVGIFGSFARWEDQGSIGTIAFGGGGGFGGFGNAGNGGNGGNATVAIASGGNGGDGGNGGFGGGGGAGGFGGTGGTVGRPGQGGFGGGTGGVGYGGSGGGLGGAIFIRSGSLLLNQVSFERNAAIAGPGPAPGQGKGGAIFISPGP
ncbi:MAG: hypothetical protein AAF808_03665, partial [Cyanobacteria bacterium P01_D01_bin.2]